MSPSRDMARLGSSAHTHKRMSVGTMISHVVERKASISHVLRENLTLMTGFMEEMRIELDLEN